MAESDLERLKATYQAWHDSKGDKDVWLNVMGDDVCIRSMDETSPGLEFAKDRFSRQEAVDYLGGILDAWSMIHWTPETFVCEGDLIAMFGRCAWTSKTTGKSADVRIAHLFRSRDGKVVEMTEIFDSARAAAAAVA